MLSIPASAFNFPPFPPGFWPKHVVFTHFLLPSMCTHVHIHTRVAPAPFKGLYLILHKKISNGGGVLVLIQEAELHVSSGPSSSSGWLQLRGSQGNFPEQLPGTGEEGGTSPSIPDGSLHCWAAGEGFTQALLFMDVSLLLAFCWTLSRLLLLWDVLPCICSHTGISLKPWSSLECWHGKLWLLWSDHYC